MNYLAHLFLSGDDFNLIMGNFIADHIKGKEINNYPVEIVKGIKLHRAIDQFTDQHPIVELSKARLRPQFKKYAPVIVDVYYDHFLARDWNKFHALSLEQYAAQTYLLLKQNEVFIPEKARLMLGYMERQNWLLNYKSIEGIHKALSGMSKRTTFDSKMELAALALQNDYTNFEKEFDLFFDELIDFVKSEIDHQQ